MSFYRSQLEEWLSEQVVRADTVYDIGGAQGSVKDRVKSWDVKNYKVLDLPEWNLDRFWTGEELDESCDIIFCLEVFEYLIQPAVAINNIYETLKFGGKAYITFAFVYPHHNELELDSLRYTETGVKRLAEATNLKVANIIYRVDESGLLNAFYNKDGMKKARQYEHHDATGFIVELKK